VTHRGRVLHLTTSYVSLYSKTWCPVRKIIPTNPRFKAKSFGTRSRLPKVHLDSMRNAMHGGPAHLLQEFNVFDRRYTWYGLAPFLLQDSTYLPTWCLCLTSHYMFSYMHGPFFFHYTAYRPSNIHNPISSGCCAHPRCY
jgi:hypothetical protein